MKLLRHILSHLFLISFLIVVVSVFYYRSFLFPVAVVEKIDKVANDIYPPSVKFVSARDYFWSIKGEKIISFDDLNIFKKSGKTDNQQDKKTAVTIASADENIPEKNSETKQVEVVANATVTKEEKVKPVESSAEVLMEVAESNKESNKNTAKEIILPVKDSDSSSENELLISARTAFNRGDMILSEKKYMELASLANDDADVYGELGNVYYAQGKWDKAGQAYYDAATRLISEGNTEQVAYLHRVIQGLSAEHAEKLSQLMSGK